MTFRPAPFFVIGDGQSLMRAPSDTDNVLIRMMANFTDTSFVNKAVLGANNVALTNSITDRIVPYVKCALSVVVFYSEGTSDCAQGNQTGLQMYTDQCVYADALRALGVDKIVTTTLVRSNGLMSPADNTERLDFNSRLLADGGAHFDAVADWAANSVLADYTNAAVYPDGVHFSAMAAGEAEDVATPVIAPFLT